MTPTAGEPTVRVEPLGAEIPVREGEGLMGAAERLGYGWPTLCHGHAQCTACWIEVEDPEAFEPAAPLEVKALSLFDGRSFYAGKHIRLACQARPLRNTVVTKRGVKGPS